MRNKEEQIKYIMKHRRDGMSDSDFEKELRNLANISYFDGRNESNTNWWRDDD